MKILKRIGVFIVDLPRQWRAETPKLFKWIRNVAATVAAAVPVVQQALEHRNAPAPEWFTSNLWLFIAIPAIITFVAGTKEEKPIKYGEPKDDPVAENEPKDASL